MIDALKNLQSTLTDLEAITKKMDGMTNAVLGTIPEGEDKERMIEFMKSVKASAKTQDHKGILSKIAQFKKDMDASRD